MRDLLNKYKKLLLKEDTWILPTDPNPLGVEDPCFHKEDMREHACCSKCDPKYSLPWEHECFEFCKTWGKCCSGQPGVVKEEKGSDDETEMEEFAEKRGSGAEKISDSAKEKGGLSLLTYNHFRVKLPYYKKASEGKLNMEDAKKEYNKLLEKLHSSTKGDMNITQKGFQELMGKIEVLGELLLENNG
jgi:hypothetical protein